MCEQVHLDLDLAHGPILAARQVCNVHSDGSCDGGIAVRGDGRETSESIKAKDRTRSKQMTGNEQMRGASGLQSTPNRVLARPNGAQPQEWAGWAGRARASGN